MNKRLNRCFKTIKAHSRNISILDVGARCGLGWPWLQLNPELIDAILVEPDPQEAKRLKGRLSQYNSARVIEHGLWDGQKKVTLNINKAPRTSSVFEANTEFLNQFPDAQRFNLSEAITIPTTTIDHLVAQNEIPSFDFAKIDIQGGELAALKGGAQYLKSQVVGLEIEVEFVEMYKGQPLFGDIDDYVRNELGLELWDISKHYWKYKEGMQVAGPTKGRFVFGDALYLRPLTKLAEWLEQMPEQKATEKILMLLKTALAYGYIDYAHAILKKPVTVKYLSHLVVTELLKSIASLGKGFRPIANGNNKLYWLFNGLANAFKVSYQGWATHGGSLGSRKKGPFWY